MSTHANKAFAVNGRVYHPPARPLGAICLDGSADEYLDAAIARGRMPNLQHITTVGHRGFARGAMPSFTNVNNSSIVTGVPPSVHGIGGNFFLDPVSGQEVMMNSATFLRCETLFPAAAKAGRKVAVVTAKEKLRDIFASGLIPLGGIAFSSEKASLARMDTHGIDDVESLVGPAPPIYSADASLYVLRAGVRLIETQRADFLYVSTTDFMQHKFAPEAPEALQFYEAIDVELGHLIRLGTLLAITADHGMNNKQKADGSPNVIYLESELVAKFGPGFRVILPITDPYVAHHGALGSFAVIHLPPPASAGLKAKVLNHLARREGITEIYAKDAARRLELPADRLGDIVAISGRDVVLGRTPDYHDLTAVASGLRSHGGRYEEMVPFIISEQLNPAYTAKARADVRNFHLFDYLANGTRLPG